MRTLGVYTILCLLSGCVQAPDAVSPEIPTPSAKGVYIVSEGNWGRGNSMLTYYDLEDFRVYNDVFTAVNGRALGDVGNAMVMLGGRGYIVVNNSDRVEIIDVSTNKSLGTLDVGSGRSPRQIAFAGDSLALVTALYDNSVVLFRLADGQMVDRISVGNNPEGIVMANGKAYVANSGLGTGNSLSVIDVSSRTVTQTITVGENPSGVAQSADGLVYVVCGGLYNDFADPNDDTPAMLAVVDPAMDAVVDTIWLTGHATSIAIGPNGLAYVPTSTAVLTIDTRARRVAGTFVTGSYYGVGIEAVTGDVYLTDPKNYTLPGEVVVFAPNGQIRNRFTAGVIPGSIAFKR